MSALYIITPIVTFLLGAAAGVGIVAYAFHVVLGIEGYLPDRRPISYTFGEDEDE